MQSSKLYQFIPFLLNIVPKFQALYHEGFLIDGVREREDLADIMFAFLVWLHIVSKIYRTVVFLLFPILQVTFKGFILKERHQRNLVSLNYLEDYKKKLSAFRSIKAT